MAKPNKPSPSVTPMADILAMKQPDRLALFASKDASRGVLCLELGKLFRAIEANLKGGQKIFPLLEKQGVRKGNISNANYVAKVFDLVDAGLITEAEFDRNIGITEAIAIARVISSRSKKQLTREQVADHIKAGGDFADDLASLYEHGQTEAERAKAEADATLAKAASEAEAKTKAAADAKALAEATADNEALQAQLAEAQANASPAAQPTAPDSGGEPSDDAPEEGEEGEEADEAPAPTAATPTAITSKDLLDLLDEVEQAIPDLSEADQQIVAARLIEMADRVCAAGIIPDPAGAKEPDQPSAASKKAKKRQAAVA